MNRKFESPDMSYMSKFVGALIGVLVMVIVASWQLFLLSARDTSGLSLKAGRFHLWLAATAGIAASVAGGLMFYFFKRHEKNKWSKVPMTPAGPLLSATGEIQSTARRPQTPFHPIHWRLANSWLTEGGAADRMPMNGSVPASRDNPSGQRAIARGIHQLMFKKWSQARHD